MNSILARRIGQRIAFYIKQRGYKTIELFAHESDIDKSSLGKIIRGTRTPRVDTLIKISEALQITLNDLYLNPTAAENEIEYGVRKPQK